MTKLLDILEDFCYVRKYKYSRIDGTMNFEDRQGQVSIGCLRWHMIWNSSWRASMTKIDALETL
jgi:catabolite regulation protein CreA